MTAAARTRRPHGDRGAATLAVALGAGLAMVLVVSLVNLMVFQWGEGAVRAALDEAARNGARHGDTALCESRANATLAELAGGLADGVTVECAVEGRSITATATVSWDGWLTGLADRRATLVASAALEDR